mgnify:CR=1 FL=1
MLTNSLRSAAMAAIIATLSPFSLASLQTQTIAEGLDTPWSIAELPDDQGFLITERPGGLKHLSVTGEMTDVDGVPSVYAERQGVDPSAKKELLQKVENIVNTSILGNS